MSGQPDKEGSSLDALLTDLEAKTRGLKSDGLKVVALIDGQAGARGSSCVRRACVITSIAALACGGEPVQPDRVAELAAPGPHAVGFRSMPVTYDAPITGAPRTTEVLVWYPARASGGERPLYLVRASEVAVIDAPALDLGQLPVVVFSHGHQAYASVMSALMEHLASHGFLAIAPMHTDNTFVDGDDRKTEMYYLRVHDVRVALDRMGGDGPALIMGHSFGGYTAFAAAGARYDIDALSSACAGGTGSTSFCSTLDAAKAEVFRAGLRNPRFSGVFAIDSGDFDLFGAAGVAAVEVPTLHMVAEQSVVMPRSDAYWPALRADRRTRILLKGGAHNDFTDSCGAGVPILCSELSPAEVRRMVNVYGLAFARSVLLGDASVDPILQGGASVSSLVELATQ